MSQFSRSSVPHSAFARSGFVCALLELFHQNAQSIPSLLVGSSGGISQSLRRLADSISGATLSPIPAPPQDATASVVTAASASAPSTGAKKSGRSVVTCTVTNPAGESQLGKKVGYPETRSAPVWLATA
jgi:hypothetical protein